MKRIALFITAIFICGAAIAQTIRWHIGDQTYQTTCTVGDNVVPPNVPEKNGFVLRWVDYRPITYIRGSGQQYINTELKVNSEYRVEITGSFNCGELVCGEKNATFSSGAFVLGIACSSGYSRWGGSQGNTVASYLNTITNTTIKIDKNGIYNDDYKKIPFTPPQQTVFSNEDFLLFPSRATINHLVIYNESNVVVRDMIPVLNRDGIACMFDKVEGKYYYNAGSGNFIAGSIIEE